MIEFHIQQFALAQDNDAILQDIPNGLRVSRIIFDVPTMTPDLVEVTFETPGTTVSTIEALHNLLGKPKTTVTIPFPSSISTDHGVTSSNLVEHAFSWFPVSKLTPEFQRQIESDFARFDSILVKDSQRDSIITSWSEEIDHPELGEKAKAFAVFVGWQRLDMFQQLLEKDSYKEAIPILFAWKAPFRMWLTQRVAS